MLPRCCKANVTLITKGTKKRLPNLILSLIKLFSQAESPATHHLRPDILFCKFFYCSVKKFFRHGSVSGFSPCVTERFIGSHTDVIFIAVEYSR